MSTEGYAPVPNWMYRDPDVSMYAILVFGALASHQGKGGIFPSWATLAKEARCSRRSVANALNELEELGAVVRTRRTSKKGRASSGYELRFGGRLNPGEEYVEDESEVSAPDAPTSDSAPGAPGECTTRQVTPYIEEEPLKKNPYSPQAVFDAFWDIYPRREAKRTAHAALVKALKAGTDPEAILEGARRYASDQNLPEKKFIPHPSTWLNGERWEDEALPSRDGGQESAFTRNLEVARRAFEREQAEEQGALHAAQ